MVDPGRGARLRLLGLFLGSSSRRLLGDYLAIVTLFFGQAFVVFTNAANPYGITNGSNGLANVDPLTFFGGHLTISRLAATTGSCSAASPSC